MKRKKNKNKKRDRSFYPIFFHAKIFERQKNFFFKPRKKNQDFVPIFFTEKRNKDSFRSITKTTQFLILLIS